MTRVKLHDYGCTLKAFRQEIIQHIKLCGELHRFIPAIASNVGVSIAEVKVNHRKRRHGKSKYSVWRFPKVILDLLTVKFLLSYSTRPLQVFGIIGLISGIIGGVICLWLAYVRLIRLEGISGRPILLLGILLVVIGIQFITLGLLAEVMVRAYHESTEKRIYFIREIFQAESLALVDFLGKLGCLVLVHLSADFLHQGKHVAHPQDSGSKTVGVEWLQGSGLLTHTQKLDGFASDLANG